MSTHWAPFDAIVMRTQSALESKGYGKTYREHHPDALTIPLIQDDPRKYMRNEDVQEAIYSSFRSLAVCLNVGDTFELPNGMTVKVEFKPEAHLERF